MLPRVRSAALWMPVVLVFVAPLAAFAETFFIRPVTGAGLPADELQSVNELVAMGVRAVKGARVTEKEAGADAVIGGRVVKLGSAYVLGLTKSRNGEVVFQTQGRAASLEDMDTVAARAARAVINETSFDGEGRVNDVTEDEVDRSTLRKRARGQYMFTLGPAFSSKLGTDNAAVGFGASYAWAVKPQFDVKLSLNFVNVEKSSAGSNDISVGVNYYFTDGDIAPFVTGDFGYGTFYTADYSILGGLTGTRRENDKASGFIGSIGGGMKFFRTSSVGLSVMARVSTLSSTTYLGRPMTGAFLVGLHF